MCLGVQRLAARSVRTLTGIPDRTAHLTGLTTLLLLLLPVTPLAYYLPYFGTDGFLILLFLWFGVLWLDSYPRFPGAGPRERLTRAAGLTALAGSTLLVRQNTVVLLPVFAGLLVALHGRGHRRAAAAWCLVLIASRPAAAATAYACYRIEQTHPEDQVMALDLVGLVLTRPEALADLPFTAASLDGDRYKRDYMWGYVESLYPWGPKPPVVKPGYARGQHERIAAEYRAALAEYPGTIATVKLRTFAAYLLEPAPFWHNLENDPNGIGLYHNPKRQAVRSLHAAVDQWVYANPGLQWLSVRHVLWFGVNLFGVAGLGYMIRRRPSRPAAGVLLVSLVPLGYYLSYALAVTTNHFRLMYPSTLTVQVVAVGLVVNGVRQRLAAAADRMPA
jgi:hypothetical protein